MPATSTSPCATYTVYGARWWVLFLFSWLSASQCAVSLTFGPICEPAKAFYGLTNGSIGLLALYAPLAFLLACIPVMRGLDHPRGGLRNSFFIAGALPHLVSGALRCGATSPATVWLLHVAQLMNGAVGVVALSAPAKIAQAWFPPHERVLATGVITLANAFGAAVGFVLMPAQVAMFGVYNMLLQWAGITAVPLLLGMIYLPDAPPSPPSRSAAVQQQQQGGALDDASVNAGGGEAATWWQQLYALCTQRDVILLCVSCGLPNGFIAAMMNVLGVVLGSSPWNMTDSVSPSAMLASSSWLGTWATLFGVIAGIAIGPVSYRLMRCCGYRSLLLLLSASMLLCFAWFAATASQSMPGNAATVQLAFIAGSTLCSAALPLFIELACEVSYPIPPALVNGFMQAGYSAGILLFLVIGLVSNVFNDNPILITWLTPVGTAVTLVLLMGVTGLQKRMVVDVPLGAEGMPTQRLPPFSPRQSFEVDAVVVGVAGK